MRLKGELLGEVVERNINRACSAAAQQGQTLLADPVARQHLTRLTSLLAAVEAEMHRLDLAGLCTACASEPGGSCCFAGMASEADAVVLTINHLLGVTPRVQDGAADACCFLGPEGCALRCKPAFCLSYSCPKMLKQYSQLQLTGLDAACAALLREQLALETCLQQRLHVQEHKQREGLRQTE